MLRPGFIAPEWARSDLTGRAWRGKVRFPDRTYEPQLPDFPFDRRRSTPVSVSCLFKNPFYLFYFFGWWGETMTNLEPLKSAISFLAVDDTSLAMPSANQHRSGQQRVLEQVQTMRMRKSRHFSNTSLSPTSKKRTEI